MILIIAMLAMKEQMIQYELTNVFERAWKKYAGLPVDRAIQEDYFEALVGPLVFLACLWLVVAALMTGRMRGMALRRIAALVGANGDSLQRAATISSLVAGRDPDKVLEDGERKFRVLPVEALTEADLQPGTDLASKEASKALNARSRNAALGTCDGFFSHSWSDDGTQSLPGSRSGAPASRRRITGPSRRCGSTRPVLIKII